MPKQYVVYSAARTKEPIEPFPYFDYAKSYCAMFLGACNAEETLRHDPEEFREWEVSSEDNYGEDDRFFIVEEIV